MARKYTRFKISIFTLFIPIFLSFHSFLATGCSNMHSLQKKNSQETVNTIFIKRETSLSQFISSRQPMAPEIFWNLKGEEGHLISPTVGIWDAFYSDSLNAIICLSVDGIFQINLEAKNVKWALPEREALIPRYQAISLEEKVVAVISRRFNPDEYRVYIFSYKNEKLHFVTIPLFPQRLDFEGTSLVVTYENEIIRFRNASIFRDIIREQFPTNETGN